MKELTLLRDATMDTYVKGRIMIDGKEVCKTLEYPPAHGSKDKGGIPSGEYSCASIPHNHTMSYRLLNTAVSNSVLITVGSSLKDTGRGNILVGQDFSYSDGAPSLTGSTDAMQKLCACAGHAIALKVCNADTCDDGYIRFKNNSFVDADNENPEYQDWKVPKGCGISLNEKLMRRGIDVLHPVTKRKIQKTLDKCSESGLKVLILDTLRTKEEQDRLYDQSRTTPPTGPRVTNAKGAEGVHVWGHAVDFCQNIRGQEYSDIAFFSKVGDIAESLGLEWGGNWKLADRPHIQDSELIGGTSPVVLIDKYGDFEAYRQTW